MKSTTKTKTPFAFPRVIGEMETMRQVFEGKSLSRFGDGECRLMEGSGCVSQIANMALRNELRDIMHSKSKDCLIGIPTLDPKGPKFGSWAKYKTRFAPFMRERKTYHSAFVSRPDSAPWIATPEYFDLVESLWRDQVVVLVHCGERSLNPDLMRSAKGVVSILCPRRDAYPQIDDLEQQVIATGIRRVILCAGATATCLAHRLALRGIHAIDLGHAGLFWRCYQWPHWEYKYHE